jgi:mono/diheme cytochrome c family protein
LRPVFERACAVCHGSRPPSGIDLTTASAWESRRAVVRRRVIEERDMPPPGHELDEAGCKAIDEWTAD